VRATYLSAANSVSSMSGDASYIERSSLPCVNVTSASRLAGEGPSSRYQLSVIGFPHIIAVCWDIAVQERIGYDVWTLRNDGTKRRSALDGP